MEGTDRRIINYIEYKGDRCNDIKEARKQLFFYLYKDVTDNVPVFGTTAWRTHFEHDDMFFKYKCIPSFVIYKEPFEVTNIMAYS